MNTYQQEELKKLLNQFSIFQHQVDEKLDSVISDTETSVIEALLATKKIATVVQSYQNILSECSQSTQNQEISKDVLSRLKQEQVNILGIIVEMQSNFQFHDIVRQSIERMQNAMSQCDDILQSLEYAMTSNEELNYLVRRMMNVNQEYQELENRHAKVSPDFSTKIELF